MSEEKGKCKCGRELYCTVCACDLHDELEEECKGLTDEIKSLESRLKEAESKNVSETIKAIRDTKGTIKVDGSAKDILRLSEENDALKARLSQAEAENQVLRDENIAYNKNYLKLMDVAGHLKSTLEPFAHWDWESGSPCASVWWDEKAREAKLALAKWDGIKEGGK